MPIDGRGRSRGSLLGPESGAGTPTKLVPVPPPKPPTPDESDNLFQTFRRQLAPREGGLANRPISQDPGGKTFKGITSRDLPSFRKAHPDLKLPTDVTKLTDPQIDAVLRREFFDRSRVAKVAALPGVGKSAPQLPEQLFDAAVLHGAGNAGKLLQESLDDVLGGSLRITDPDGKKVYDGVVGSKTRDKIAEAARRGLIKEVNNRMVERRVAFMRRSSALPSNSGWIPRARSFRIGP